MRQMLETRFYAVVVLLKNTVEGNEEAALERLGFLLGLETEHQGLEALRRLGRELNTLLYYKAQEYKVNFQKSHEIYLSFDRQLERQSSPDGMARLLEKLVCTYCERIREDSRRQYSNLIRNCLDYIDWNFTEPITVESEALRMNVSRSYLSHRFVQETGCRMTEYVTNLRIRYGCALLENLQLPIQQVAQTVGFSTANYFARAFRERMGMSPRAYRAVRQKGTVASEKTI